MHRRGFLALPLGAFGLPAPAGEDKRSTRRYTSVAVAGVVTRWVQDAEDCKAINFGRVAPLIARAADEGARIVCTTECFLDGYQIEVSDHDYDDVRQYLEDPDDGEYVQKLKALARSKRIYIAAGMAVADPRQRDRHGKPKPFNSCQLYSPDGTLLGAYYKTHNHGKRAAWFSAVPEREKSKWFPHFETSHGRIGSMICNDRQFSETTRWLAANGSGLILCPTGGSSNYDMLRNRSRETGLGIVWVHPCGFAATGPDGRILAEKFWKERTKGIASRDVGGPADHREVVHISMPARA